MVPIVQIPRELSVRPQPFASESILGYWIRLSIENGIDFPRLIRMFPPQYSHQCSEPRTDLSSWAGQHITSPHPINPRWVMANNVRWCPLCLLENRYWRAHWELAMISSCPLHKINLFDRCPRCNSQLYYRNLNFEQCICGYQLSGSSNAVSTTSSAVQRAILFSLYPKEFSKPEIDSEIDLNSLNYDQLHKFILFVGCDNLACRKPHYKTDISWAISAAKKFDELLIDWPKKYFEILDQQLLKHPTESRLMHQFGFYYRAVFKEFRDKEFFFLRKATEQYLSEQWLGTLDRRHRFLSEETIQKNGNICQTTIAKSLNLPLKKLRRFISDGQVNCRFNLLNSGRTRAIIPRNEMPRIENLANTLTLSQAAHLLTIPNRRVSELIDGNIIYGASPKPGQRWLIPRIQLNELLIDLNNLPRFKMSDPITWDEIFRRYLPRNISLSTVILEIFDGRIKISTTVDRLIIKNFNDFRVCRKDLKIWLMALSEGLSIPAAAKSLNIKQEVAYHLVNEGHIQASHSDRLGRRIADESILRFRNDYITAVELAKNLNLSSRSLERQLASIGVFPAMGPKIDGCRQNIFKRQFLV